MKKVALHSKIPDLISMIYDSALEPERWSVFLSEIRSLTNSKSVCVLFQSPENQFPVLVNENIDSGAMAQYFDYYYELDSCFTFAEKHASYDKFFSTVQAVPNKKSLVSAIGEEYYHDFHIKSLGADEMVCCVFDPAKNSGSFVALHKAIGQPFADAATLSALQQLVPHLQRAQKISQKLVGLSQLNNALYESMQQLKQGVILFDSLGKPIFINTSAERMIANHPLITLSHQGIDCQSHSENVKLDQLLRQTILSRFGKNTSGGGSLLLGQNGNTGQTKPLSIMISPVHSRENVSLPLPSSACAMMLISDMSAEIPAYQAFLTELYGLTPSETRVATSIANGNSLEEIATTNQTSIHTVRNQLKAIFSKTDTHRQTELVKLILELSSTGRGKN